jgi:hypothetical protein
LARQREWVVSFQVAYGYFNIDEVLDRYCPIIDRIDALPSGVADIKIPIQKLEKKVHLSAVEELLELDVPFDEYLAPFAVLSPGKLQEKNIQEEKLEVLPIHKSEYLEEASLLVELWKDWRRGRHDQYKAVTDAFNMQCLYDLPLKE